VWARTRGCMVRDYKNVYPGNPTTGPMPPRKESTWQDPDHPGNKIRPKVRCVGCGKLGCITAWGPWCFECNVPRMTRIDARIEEMAKSIGLSRLR
jgi:hypothetical protein